MVQSPLLILQNREIYEVISTYRTFIFTDGSIMLQANPKMKVLLFGAGEADLCHKANEYVYLDKYYKSIEILTAYALDK